MCNRKLKKIQRGHGNQFLKVIVPIISFVLAIASLFVDTVKDRKETF